MRTMILILCGICLSIHLPFHVSELHFLLCQCQHCRYVEIANLYIRYKLISYCDVWFAYDIGINCKETFAIGQKLRCGNHQLRTFNFNLMKDMQSHLLWQSDENLNCSNMAIVFNSGNKCASMGNWINLLRT